MCIEKTSRGEKMIPKTHLNAVYQLHEKENQEISVIRKEYNKLMKHSKEHRMLFDEMISFMESLEEKTIAPAPVEATSIKEMLEFMQNQTRLGTVIKNIVRKKFTRKVDTKNEKRIS